MKAPKRRAAIPFNQLFYPRAIAIVGVNESPYGGAFFLRCLKSSEFPNPIYLINPKLAGTTIMGCNVYPSILEIPDDPPADVLIVAVRAENTPEIVELAGQKGIPFVHIFSSGYAEVGRGDLEVALIESARKTNVRIIGPNCLGAYTPRAKTAIAEDMSPVPGDVAFIGQSGNLASMLGINGPSRGYYFSKIVSIGNQIDVDLLDFFQYFRDDQETRVISAYIENVKRDGPQLVPLLQSITPTKPIVIWKGGVAESGQAAVMSHTGALAGNYQLWRAMANQTGAILVDTFQELSEMNQALSLAPIPDNRGVAIMTVGGGISVEITDTCETYGLVVPPLSEDAQERIRQFIPDVNTNVRNPLDLGFMGLRPETYGRVIAILADEPQISSIIMIRDPERFPIYARSFNLQGGDEYTDLFVEGISLAKSPQKIVASVPSILEDGEQTRTAIARFTKKLLEKQVITFDNIQAAAKCIYRLWKYGNYLRRRGLQDR
ncbi:MAG TPA: CoA-binding protein [Candidatus Lokiarchaeia archaeon]|nr:CoA-binding protein [Candidatus Lokiarchaeia archaeon]